MSVRSAVAAWITPASHGRRTSVLISVPRSECTLASLHDPESVASIIQDESRRCDNIGFGRDPSNSDTTRRERGVSPCEPIGQSCTCQSTTRAPRTPHALPRQCLTPNHPRRMSGDRLSSHAPTCFRGDHRRVDPRHAGRTDTGFHQTMLAPRTRQGATCQPSWVKNLHSHPETISRQAGSRSRIFPCTDSLGRPIPISRSIAKTAREWSRAGWKRHRWATLESIQRSWRRSLLESVEERWCD
jgi:hypothetical protein